MINEGVYGAASDALCAVGPPWYVWHATGGADTRQGADGGTIARRDDLVRTRTENNKSSCDPEELRHSAWTLCRLSKRPLRKPILLDRLGLLYNKEGVLEYLLRRNSKEATDVENDVAGHIKNLKVRRALLC